MGKLYYLKTPDEPFRSSPRVEYGRWYKGIGWARAWAEEIARSGSSPNPWQQLIEVSGGFKYGTHRVIAEHRTGYGWETSLKYGSRTEHLIDWESVEPSLPLSQKREIIVAASDLIPDDGKVTRPKDLSMAHLPSGPGMSAYAPSYGSGYASDPPYEPIASQQPAHIHADDSYADLAYDLRVTQANITSVDPATRQTPTLPQAVTFHE